MSIKYNIEVPDDIFADFWKFVTENFNVILLKKQHSVDADILHIKLKIHETKTH